MDTNGQTSRQTDKQRINIEMNVKGNGMGRKNTSRYFENSFDHKNQVKLRLRGTHCQMPMDTFRWLEAPPIISFNAEGFFNNYDNKKNNNNSLIY